MRKYNCTYRAKMGIVPPVSRSANLTDADISFPGLFVKNVSFRVLPRGFLAHLLWRFMSIFVEVEWVEMPMEEI